MNNETSPIPLIVEIVIPNATASSPANTEVTDEQRAIFSRLRKLKRSFGPKPDKNDVALALIGACISEGFDTRKRITGALSYLDMNEHHIKSILNRYEGVDANLHHWRRDSAGRFHLTRNE